MYGLHFLLRWISFGSLFFVIILHLLKEQKRFVSKFCSLSTEKVRVAKTQNINKEILTGTLDYKI